MKIGMIGTGYVGLVSGACFAEEGHTVFCVDRDEAKIACLKQGGVPFYEPGLPELVERNIKEGRLFFTTQLAEIVSACEVLFIAVGTPPGGDGQADLSFVLECAEQMAHQMQEPKTIVIKSTVPVGTGKKVWEKIHYILKERGLSFQVDVVSNPEFLKEGSAVEDCLHPERVVVGVLTTGAQALMNDLYAPVVKKGALLLVMDVISSEMTKYASNALLATKISFMNELAPVCEKLGVDLQKVRAGMATDSRIGPHFISPGLGYGGSCFPKDVSALLHFGRAQGEPMRLMEAVEKVNQEQRQRFIQRVWNHLEKTGGRRVALWGLAFKPGTDDLREAPSLDLIQALCEKGCIVAAYDPVAMIRAKEWREGQSKEVRQGLVFAENPEDPYGVLVKAEMLCLVTEWPCFRAPDWDKMALLMKQKVIFDGRNVFYEADPSHKGFEYHSVGRPPSLPQPKV